VHVENEEQATSSTSNSSGIQPEQVENADQVAHSNNTAGIQFKSSLFDNLHSSVTYHTKLPQDWNQNDVVMWLEENEISKQSIESFKGIT
jgi:hypothetical protein